MAPVKVKQNLKNSSLTTKDSITQYHEIQSFSIQVKFLLKNKQFLKLMFGTSLVIQTVYYLPIVFTKLFIYQQIQFGKKEQMEARRLSIWYYAIGLAFGLLSVLILTEHLRKVSIKAFFIFMTLVMLISIIVFSAVVLN